MLTVEFFGIPGSGKTRISRIVSRKLAEMGIESSSPVDRMNGLSGLVRLSGKLLVFMRYAAFHPVSAARIMWLIARTEQESARDAIRSLANTFFTVAVLEYGKERVLILDQGSLQAAFTVLYAAGKAPAEGLYDILPVPDILVEVSADDRIVTERLGKRRGAGSRMESNPSASLERAKKVLSSVRETPLYARAGRTMLIDANNDPETADAAASKIAKRIAEGLIHENGY